MELKEGGEVSTEVGWAEVPEGMRAFVASNGLPADAYQLRGLYRFVRLNPRLWSARTTSPLETAAVLQRELGGEGALEAEAVEWLPGFYRLPHSASISDSDLYKTGKIYGIDASSGAAVVALDPQPGDNVLDLCCAPGAKLCMIADMLAGQGTVTGVDIAEARLGACRNVLAKYEIPNARLVLHDGTTVNVLAPPRKTMALGAAPTDKTTDNNEEEEEEEEEEAEEETKEGQEEEGEAKDDDGRGKTSTGRICRHVSKKRDRAELAAARWRKKTKRKRVLPDELPHVFYAYPYDLCLTSASAQLYDRVMIDAQCTLDASVRHILHYGKLGWKDFTPRITEETVDLQKRLLANGFRLLAPGGYLVYSTCSFCREQNEDVVSWLLEREPTARVVPIPGADRMPCSKGLLPHTLRFYPRDTQTSGLFIAKLTKLAEPHATSTSTSSTAAAAAATDQVEDATRHPW